MRFTTLWTGEIATRKAIHNSYYPVQSLYIWVANYGMCHIW